MDLATLAQMVFAFQDHPSVREDLRNAFARLTHAAYECKLCDPGCVSDYPGRRAIRYIVATIGLSHMEALKLNVENTIKLLRATQDVSNSTASLNLLVPAKQYRLGQRQLSTSVAASIIKP